MACLKRARVQNPPILNFYLVEANMLKSAISKMIHKTVRVLYDNHRVCEGILAAVDNARDLIVVKCQGAKNLVISVERVKRVIPV